MVWREQEEKLLVIARPCQNETVIVSIFWCFVVKQVIADYLSTEVPG